MTLRETPRLATLVLALTIDHAVFVFSDGQDTATARFTSVDQEFLISLCPNLVHFDSPEPTGPSGDHSSVWPASLTSLRVANLRRTPTNATSLSRVVVDLQALPRTLTRLRLSCVRLDSSEYFLPADQTFLLPHLRALILDNSSVPEEVFRWLVTGPTALRVLHVWLVAGMTDDSMEQIISSNSDGLREFMFKPVYDLRNPHDFIPHHLVRQATVQALITFMTGY